MKSFDLARFRVALSDGRVEWRKHVLERLAERDIPQRVALETLRTGERIEEYLNDWPFPSALFLAYRGGKPYHVVAAFDETHEQVYIITAYEPSLEVFESDYRTRKQK